MRKDKYYLGFYILVGLIFIGINYYLYKFHYAFVSSSFLTSLITLVVGGVVIILYLVQKRDNKKDAAKIIIQEIRRAEQIIDNYRENGSYQFNRKIIATNSWNKNIHYFVDDLDSDELDKISDLYSTGEYLDYIVQRVSDITLDYTADQAKVAEMSIINGVPAFDLKMKDIAIAWKPRLDLISQNIELIYHSAIAEKLKKIAK